MSAMAKRISAGVVMAALAWDCNAATLVCNGTVDMVGYHNPGILVVKLSSMNTVVSVCSTDSAWTVSPGVGYSTTIQACKTLYTALLTAKATNAPVQAMYFDGDSLPVSCAAWPAWSSAQVRYYVF